MFTVAGSKVLVWELLKVVPYFVLIALVHLSGLLGASNVIR